jgi:hypothetical protein
MNINITSLVDQALTYYDMKSIEYKKYIDCDNISVNREDNTIKFVTVDQTIFKYDILGIFDNTTNIWIWGWMVPEYYINETVIVKKLLNYGLKIDRTDLSANKLYLKTQLVNSRFLLEDEIQLDIHIALASYLIKDNIMFVYSKIKYLSNDKKRFITVYYTIYR